MPRLIRIIGLALLLLSETMIETSPPAIQADSPTTHTVTWGETLYSIARTHGITPQSVADANGIRITSWVYAGQRLVIPGGEPAPSRDLPPTGFYVVKAGDTLFSIADRFGSSVQAISSANNLPKNGLIYVGWPLRIPTTTAPSPSASPPSSLQTEIHIVQPGEYLAMIALRHRTTVQIITLANNIPNEWLVYAGQRLVIPVGTDGVPISSASTAPVPEIRAANVPLYRQQQTLTCEEASAAMATRGAVSEAQLVRAMPRSDNPFNGIRGRTNSAYYGGLSDYGVYAQGLQKGLRALGISSDVLYRLGDDEFKEAILASLRAGQPVVWWHTWHDTYQNPVTISLADRTSVKMVPYEHAGTIVGANDRGVTYHDPYDGSVRFVTWSDFSRVSGYFDNMALVIKR